MIVSKGFQKDWRSITLDVVQKNSATYVISGCSMMQ